MGEAVDESPERFAERLRASGRCRGFVLRGPAGGALRASDPVLAKVAEHLRAAPDFADHEAVFLALGRRSGALCAAFLHTTARGQGQGGLRHRRYPSLRELLADGLRLSRAMGRKNALAGLWWGGGKGIVSPPAGLDVTRPESRRALFRDYGDFVSSLRGIYVTAEDAGTMPEDVSEVFRRTRFATCIPEAFGGSGNPARHTAAGVVLAMEAALQAEGLGGLRGRRVVVQGAGNVGSVVAGLLLDGGADDVRVGDVDDARLRALERARSDPRLRLRRVEPGDPSLLAEPCDVLAPCALGGMLGPATIPHVRARVVCGAANNPLADEARDGEALERQGVCYVPDFVANRMGIVTCANEQYGSLPDDPEILRHLDREHPRSIFQTTLRVLEHAREAGITAVAAAARLADEAAREPHPIFGHRTRAIVASLVAEGWERG